MSYWETDEYLADQAAFEAGGLTPEEIFAVAQRWGIESKIVSTKAYQNINRATYTLQSLEGFTRLWGDAGLRVGLETLLLGKVMDLGCGVTSFLEVLPSVSKAVAIDPALWAYAEHIPEKARLGQHGKCLYISGVIQDISDEDFDAVFSYNAIDHGINWEDTIKHIARVLKVGGHLLLAAHVSDGPRTGYHRRLTHPSHFSIEALSRELAMNSMRVVWQRPRPSGRKVFLSYTWARRAE